MAETKEAQELDKVVVRFVGDSGDGMQLTGSQFTFTSALFGNDLATLPDFPAEIRAPVGTVEGVSGFQVQIGRGEIMTPGDAPDVMVAMNPAALKANWEQVKKGGTIIVDTDSFDKRSLEKVNWEGNPLENETLSEFNVVEAPITSLTRTALEGSELDNKSIVRSKNMFALGIMYWLFNRDMKATIQFIESKFKGKDVLIDANKKALQAGYFYAETVEALPSSYTIPPAEAEPGTYRHINGNVATAWGMMAATEKMEKSLFYGSYPITPASDILHELAKHKHMGVLTAQMEDEIAAVCSAIGASYTGQLGVTGSAGPGIALKGEAIGLAAMVELPLIIIDVQRGGPSTGLPTKTEQSDLAMAVNGRNGDSEIIVIAASTPANCFNFGYEAAKLTMEHMTPVMLLTDGYLANGSEPWKFPNMSDMPEINIPLAKEGSEYEPYVRDPETLARFMAVPGMPGLEHRVGGLEKDFESGNVSYDPINHHKMSQVRSEKVQRVANYIPEQTIEGDEEGDLLVVGWGGTYGALSTAVKELHDAGKKVSLAQFNYINPLPKNTADVLGKFNKILVCELNLGQFAGYLRDKQPGHHYEQYNKVQGLPFTVFELKDEILKHLK